MQRVLPLEAKTHFSLILSSFESDISNPKKVKNGTWFK
jgi:hypothetical protein